MKQSHCTTKGFAVQAQEALATLGYEPGAPEHIKAETLAVDKEVAGCLRCPACGKRSMTLQAFHRGRSYAALAVCSCGGASEL